MNVPTLLPIVAGALTLGLIVGGVISNLRKGNKEQQSEVIQLQQNEITAFKSSNERLTQDKAVLLGENNTLKKSNADLKEIAQQTPEIRKLIKVVSRLVTQIAKSNALK